jgi:hypothetical protein
MPRRARGLEVVGAVVDEEDLVGREVEGAAAPAIGVQGRLGVADAAGAVRAPRAPWRGLSARATNALARNAV